MPNSTFRCIGRQRQHSAASNFDLNTPVDWLFHMTPPYLCDGLQRVTELSWRWLRSSVSNALVVPATRLVTVGDRAFPVTGAYGTVCQLTSCPQQLYLFSVLV